MQEKRGRRIARLTMVLIAALTALALSAPLAQAAFGVEAFEATMTNEDGSVATQASGHPFATTTNITVNTTTQEVTLFGMPFHVTIPDESLRDAVVELPAGFAGSTTAVPTCTNAQLLGDGNTPKCPNDAQVGVARVGLVALFGTETQYFPIYNMVPPPGVPASFGFNALGVPVYLAARVRSESDYGLSVEAREINQTLAILSTATTFWGVPADPSHDDQRCHQLGTVGECDEGSAYEDSKPHAATIAAKPLLTNAGDCGAGSFTFKLKADSWPHPGAWVSTEDTLEEGGSSVGVSGCAKVPFEPTMTVTPESREAGAPTGVEATIKVPASGLENPKGIAQSPLKNATIIFPEGMTINASSADGLTSCTESEARLGSAEGSQCPAASKLGTVRIATPLLPTPLQGNVYLATQGSNPFKSLIALYISVNDPTTGIVLKIPGKVSLDPQTGRVVATFRETPELPFSEFRMRLKGGDRAALVNPTACGTYTTEANLSGWSNPGAAVSSPSSFTLDQGCSGKGGFTPGFEAGTSNPTAGSYSPFTLRVTRPESGQNLKSIAASLPPGLLAKLSGVPLCGDAAAATGACPAGSQVGVATVGVGAGTNPVYVPEAGKAPTAVYLAGPYQGAPYSLVVKVPAQAGPFDLGTVAVRNALHIDPVTTQVTTESDPLPQILEGIPVSYRDVRVEINRPEFTLNPTNCEAMQVASSLVGSGGARATPAARFQAASCASLGLAPKLAFKFSGAPTRRGGHPKLTATLTTQSGDANLRRVQVTLPETEYLENAHIRTVCTRVQYAANQCPEKSIYGYARAWTPLLDQPLEGPVYLRSSEHKLPDLVASLNGPIHIDLAGRINSYHSRIRNTFDFVPDAPVTKFVLTMQGGSKGLLVNNTNLCKAKPVANVEFNGQNGKVANTEPRVSVGGCGKGGKKK